MTTMPSLKPHGDLICDPMQCNTPGAFECIAEGILKSVGIVIPDLDRFILTATDDNREIGMKDSKRRIIGITIVCTQPLER